MIYSIIKQLKDEPSKNAKIAILQKHKNNELLKRVIVATYDPYTQYYIRKIPAYKPYTGPADKALGLPTPLSEALENLAVLSNREYTGHAAIEFLAAQLGDLSPDDAKVLEMVIDKSLDCGMTESTANKVWPSLVATYPCLLAEGYDEKTIKKMRWPAYSQLKSDGMRANAFVENGKVLINGRSGRAIDLLGELDVDLLELAKHVPLKGAFVVDGELVAVDSKGKIMERRVSNGMLNKAIKGTISKAEAATVRMKIWDVIPLAEFRAYKGKAPYAERWATISLAVSKAVRLGGVTKLDLIETREVKNLQEAEQHFAEMLANGQEGTILKDPEHIWEDRRSPGLIKMKAEKDADLVITGWVEGTGKYKGMLGALIGQSSDGKVEVSVGSGFDDNQRATLTEKDVLGKVMTILYNERIKSKARTDVDSLFLPRFVEIREDKKVANSSKEIK